MKKFIKIILAALQISLFLPTTVFALAPAGQQSTSDLGTSQHNSQNASSLDNDQVTGLQTPSNRLQQSPNSSLQLLNSRVNTGGLRVVGQGSQENLKVVGKLQERPATLVEKKSKYPIIGCVALVLAAIGLVMWTRMKPKKGKKNVARKRK